MKYDALLDKKLSWLFLDQFTLTQDWLWQSKRSIVKKLPKITEFDNLPKITGLGVGSRSGWWFSCFSGNRNAALLSLSRLFRKPVGRGSRDPIMIESRDSITLVVLFIVLVEWREKKRFHSWLSTTTGGNLFKIIFRASAGTAD